ncbi:MAG: restriction endonuclease subunit S, partial [Clostridia bacterium]|nr:restriction endonuclease subunit S [Clostridia bacterium]
YWITPAVISDDDFIIESTQRTLTDAVVRSCSLRLLPVGTVLLSSRAPIGKVAIAGVEMYCNQGFKNLICTEALNPIYVYYLLKFNSQYLNSLGRGATFKEISKSIVDNILIPVPPIQLQKEFAVFVEKTDKLKFKIKQSLEKLETLKKALMQKYFG